MSLETTLERIAAALEVIAANTKATPQAAVAPAPVATPAPTPTPAPMAPAPTPTPAPMTPAPVTPVVEPETTGPQAPFTDAAGMRDYVKATYQALGPEKGSKIIEILNELNINTIKDLQPEQYGVFYAKVEGLKVA